VGDNYTMLLMSTRLVRKMAAESDPPYGIYGSD